MAHDLPLDDLISRLAAMPARDRDFVIGQLDQNDKALLEVRNDTLRPARLSQNLQALLAHCEENSAAAGLTPRTAWALVEAVSAHSSKTIQPAEAPQSERQGLLQRTLQLLGLALP